MSLKDKLKGMVKEKLGTVGIGGSSGSSYGGSELWYITVERAEGLKDMERFSKSDPYVKLSFAGKTHKTKVIKNDRSPTWNETFEYNVRAGTQHTIQVKLLDSDVGLDDTIGEATVGGIELPDYSGQEKTIKVIVQRKDQITGVLYLRVKRVNPNMPMHQAPPQQSYGQPQGYPQQQQQQYPQNPPPQQYQQGPPPPSHYGNQPPQQQPPYQQPYDGRQGGGYQNAQQQQNYPHQNPPYQYQPNKYC